MKTQPKITKPINNNKTNNKTNEQLNQIQKQQQHKHTTKQIRTTNKYKFYLKNGNTTTHNNIIHAIHT